MGGTGSLWRINFNPSVPWFSDVASMDTKILRKRKREIRKPLFAQIRSKRFFWCPLSFNNSKIQQSLPQAQYDRHPRLPSCLSPQSTSTSLQPWLVQTTGFALSWSAGLSCWNPLELPQFFLSFQTKSWFPLAIALSMQSCTAQGRRSRTHQATVCTWPFSIVFYSRIYLMCEAHWNNVFPPNQPFHFVRSLYILSCWASSMACL